MIHPYIAAEDETECATCGKSARVRGPQRWVECDGCGEHESDCDCEAEG